MLSFRALSEKKTKIKINPKQSEITEKKGCPKCEDECGKECKCSCHDKEMDEAKYYDPMEDPDFDHDEAEATRGQSGKNKSITIKKKTKKTTKEETAYVSQEEVSEESNQESETETFLTFGQFDEATRAAKEGKKDEHRVGVEIRAKQSAATLAAKRARQKVLDAHEKKTGKKLDISKTPEGKKHAQHFGGSRQEKKVKGEKETPAETHNRRVNKNVARIVKHGYTSKEKKEVQSMAKHASRYD